MESHNSYLADYLRVGEKMIRGFDKSNLRKTFSKPRLRGMEVLVIDEIYVTPCIMTGIVEMLFPCVVST